MSISSPKESYEGYCGTSYAAKLLGISVGTVQGLVERKALKAWKTQGGHRRISLQSVYDYQRRHNLAPSALIQDEAQLRVLVVEDDETTRLLLQHSFDRWGLPLDVVMYDSAIKALLDLPKLHPQVLMTDLLMPKVDGFEFLHRLDQHALFDAMAVVAMTAMTPEEVQERGGLPDGVKLIHKPIDLEWLKGFFDALISVQQISRRAPRAPDGA